MPGRPLLRVARRPGGGASSGRVFGAGTRPSTAGDEECQRAHWCEEHRRKCSFYIKKERELHIAHLRRDKELCAQREAAVLGDAPPDDDDPPPPSQDDGWLDFLKK